MKFRVNLTLENELHGPKTVSVDVDASNPATALCRGWKEGKKQLKGVHWSSAVLLIEREDGETA